MCIVPDCYNMNHSGCVDFHPGDCLVHSILSALDRTAELPSVSTWFGSKARLVEFLVYVLVHWFELHACLKAMFAALQTWPSLIYI